MVRNFLEQLPGKRRINLINEIVNDECRMALQIFIVDERFRYSLDKFDWFLLTTCCLISHFTVDILIFRKAINYFFKRRIRHNCGISKVSGNPIRFTSSARTHHLKMRYTFTNIAHPLWTCMYQNLSNISYEHSKRPSETNISGSTHPLFLSMNQSGNNKA